jgi:serine protease
MQDNKIGGVGIAPYARGDVIGIARDVNGAYNENPPQAIMDGVSRLSKGDVMILEMQVSNETGFYYPQEVNDAEFEAIKLATAKGIIVVEPAGNGNENDAGSNLDQPLVRWGETTPRGFFIQGHPDYRDSGAIIVGAGTAAYPRSKMPWSNYGKRVDVHSWGEKIMTSTVDGSVQDTYANFGGTSGAAPIIAGAALSAQGIRVANGRAKLGALEMRSLLKTGGTPTVSSVDRIGVQPNLRALIDGGHLK